MTIINLSQQIAEISRELDARLGVYGRLVSSGKMRQSVADYQMECLKAAKDTLIRLRDAQPDIRAFLALTPEQRQAALAAGKNAKGDAA